MNPLVSIITPAYNAGGYLDSFFLSVLEQDYDNYEMIIVNDGSTDDTEDKILLYKKLFERRGIRFVYLNQENGGQARALNLAFPHMRGEYFIWPDSDDVLCPDNISTKVKFMAAHPDYALGISWAEYIDEAGNSLGLLKRVPDKNDNLFRDLLISKNVNFCPGIYIMKTSAFVESYPALSIDESRAGQNYQLLLPMAYGYQYGYIDKVLYKYVLHPSSHSNDGLQNENMQLRRFEEHERLLKRLIASICSESDNAIYQKLVAVHFARLYLRIANQHCDGDKARDCFVRLLRLKAASLKDCAYACATAMGLSLKK